MDMDAGVRVNGISQADVAKFETLFRLLDVEETGTIQEEQLADLMPRMGVFLSEEGLHSLFQSVDVDSSGTIDFNEFLILMARHREANQLALLKGGRECFRYLKAASRLTHVSRSDAISNWVFDLLALLTILWYLGIVLYEDVRQFSFPYEAGHYVKTVVGLYCFVDIGRWARTSVPSEDGPDTLPIDDAKRVRMEYITSRWFVFDLLAALPFDLLFMFLGNETAMRACQHLRLFKLFTYTRLFRLSAQDTISPAYARFYFAVVPLCKILFLACASIHILTVIWILISPDEPDYVPSVYFVVYTLTTTGYGDIPVTTDSQRCFAVFLFCCASIVTGLVVGKLVQISQQGDLQGDMSKTMLETLAALSHLTIPPDFREEVLAFQLHRLKHSNSLYNDTITGLPQCMQDRMALYARMKIVRQMSIFADASDICVAKLAQSLVNVFAPPEEYIVIAGEEGEEMFFLFHGMCCVTKPNGKWVATIKRGGLFGEVALLTETRRSSSIKSLTYCQLFRLDKVAFETIVQRFPNLLDSIQKASKCLNDRIAGNTNAGLDGSGAAASVAAVPEAAEQHTTSSESSCSDDGGAGEQQRDIATSKTEGLVRRQAGMRERTYALASSTHTMITVSPSPSLPGGSNSVEEVALSSSNGTSIGASINGTPPCFHASVDSPSSERQANKRVVIDDTQPEDDAGHGPTRTSSGTVLKGVYRGGRLRRGTKGSGSMSGLNGEEGMAAALADARRLSQLESVESHETHERVSSPRSSIGGPTGDEVMPLVRSRSEKRLLKSLGGNRAPPTTRRRASLAQAVLLDRRQSEPANAAAAGLAPTPCTCAQASSMYEEMAEMKKMMNKMMTMLTERQDAGQSLQSPSGVPVGAAAQTPFSPSNMAGKGGAMDDGPAESPHSLSVATVAMQKKPSLLKAIFENRKAIPMFDLSNLEARMDGGMDSSGPSSPAGGASARKGSNRDTNQSAQREPGSPRNQQLSEADLGRSPSSSIGGVASAASAGLSARRWRAKGKGSTSP